MNGNYEQWLKEYTSHYYDWCKDDKVSLPEMTNNLYPYNNIFSPIKINRLTVKNRIVMAPMGNISMCEETGKPNDQMLKYFEERAKGGVGLITTGLIPVSYKQDPSLLELGDLVYFPRIDRSRTVLAGWRNLTSGVHAFGSKIFIQLSAGLGRVGNPQCLLTKFKLPVSASWNPNFYIKEIPCARLSDRKAIKIIKNIAQASSDAKHCNCDGVYLHGHEGYLIEQMTNPAFNRRKIGKFADWQRFGIDMVKAIRKRVGDAYPIMYRIDISLLLNHTYGEKMNTVKSLKKFKNERTVDQSLDYMANLVKAGVDMFDVDLGCYDNWWLPHPPASMPPRCYADLPVIVKEYFKDKGVKTNAGQDVPIVAVGKLGYPDDAEKLLADKKCDMVMLGRPLLADSDWCNKAYKGETKTITPCIGCQEACINEFVEGGNPQCAVNPRCSFEYQISEEIPKAEKSKNIAVIGGGPAGIVATSTLIARGHKVDLYEASANLGGMLIPGSSPKIKYELKNYLSFLNYTIENLQSNKNFSLHLNTRVDKNMLKDKNYDSIIIACGTSQAKPPVEGINNKNVLYAIDVLNNPKLIENAKNVVVIGGGVVGCETAYFLKYELNKTVKVVEMMPYFMNKTCTANRGHLLRGFENGNVELLNCTKLVKINDKSIEISRNMSSTVPNPYCSWSPILPDNIVNPLAKKVKDEYKNITLDADVVLLSAGVKCNDSLYFDCQKENFCKEIFNIGDSSTPGRVFEATKSAYRVCRTI